MTNTLLTSKKELKSISKQKAQYVIDLHYKGMAYLDQNITEKEMFSLIDFFITMYGFMHYYYSIDQNEMAKRSQDYVIENLKSVITPETYNYLSNLILLKDDLKDADNPIEKEFIKSYHRGLNLAPHCNKQYVETKYLKLFFEYKQQKNYLENYILSTGNSEQLKNIAIKAKKHLIAKNRNK